MKTKNSTTKHFLKTTSNYKHKHTFKNHILTKMSTKHKHQLHNSSLINPSDIAKIKHILHVR